MTLLPACRRTLGLALVLGIAAVSDANAGDLFLASDLTQPVLRSSSAALHFAPAFPLGSARAMAVNPEDNVWIATLDATGPGTLLLVDPRSGATLASLPAPGVVHSMVAIDNELWVAADGSRIVRFDPRAGKVVSDWPLAFTVDALAWYGGLLYAAGPTGQVWSTHTSAPTTAPSWKLETTAFGQAVHSLAIRGSQLLVGVLGHVFIFERDTGFLLYGYNVPNNAASIVVNGNDALIGGDDGSVVRADPDTGAVVEVAKVPPPPGLPAWPISAMVVIDPDPLAVLRASQAFASISAASQIAFRMEVSPELGAHHYLVLGSASGVLPGIDAGGVHIPLNIDPYFLSGLYGPSLIEGSFGVFSDQNALGLDLADATLKLPGNLPASAAGVTLNHVFITLDDQGSPTAVSNVETIVLGF